MATANSTLDGKERERLRKREYRQRPEVKARQKEHQAKWMAKPESKAKVLSLVSEWRARHKEKKLAHDAVERAVATRKLSPLPCWTCGDPAEAHHADYSSPLDVVWLCRKHHKELHAAHQNYSGPLASSRRNDAQPIDLMAGPTGAGKHGQRIKSP